MGDLTQTDSDDVTTYLALIIGVADVTRSRFVSRFTSANASLAANNPIKSTQEAIASQVRAVATVTRSESTDAT